MECEKCGHRNSEYSIICEKCGKPLDIENNKVLQEKYHKKGKHIDIEEIEKPQHSDFNDTRKKVYKVLIAFLILLVVLCSYFIVIYFMNKNSKDIIDNYNYYMKNSSLALFYFGAEEEIDSLCQEYASSYGFDYLNIRANKLTSKTKRKMRTELNIYNVTSTLVIVQSGVPTATLSASRSKEDILSYLQENELVPQYLGKTEDSLTSFKEALESEEPTLLYFPTSYREDIEESSETIQSLATQYSMQYYEVKGYYLSKKQLLKMMSQLGFSEIQDDLIVYIVDGSVEKIIEDSSKDTSSYFKLLSSYDIIDVSSADYLINISVSQFQEFIKNNKDKYVILIGSDNCAYCDRVKPILGQIAHQNQLIMYYLNASSDWESVSNSVQQLGISTGLTNTPFMIIVEKNTILDYVVGAATKELYTEKLTEMGVIR